jgi:hypothetical protein
MVDFSFTGILKIDVDDINNFHYLPFRTFFKVFKISPGSETK